MIFGVRKVCSNKVEAELHLDWNLFASFNAVKKQLCAADSTGFVAEMDGRDSSGDGY